MKNYEITFITKEDPKESVKSILESFGAKITKTSSMGQKTFVYPIKKEKSGIYTTYLFDIDPEQVQALNRKLDMEEEVLRHLIINLKPSDIIAMKPTKEAVKTLEIAPETTIEVAPKVAIEIAPETAIEVAPFDAAQDRPEKAIIIETEKTIEETPVEKKAKSAKPKAESKKEIVKEKIIEEPKVEVKEKSVKTKKAETVVEGVNEAANKAVNEVVNEDERLEALDKKLEELLKD